MERWTMQYNKYNKNVKGKLISIQMFTVKCFQFCPVFENCHNKILEVKEALQVKHEYGFGIKFALNINVHESLNLVKTKV